MSNIVGGIAWMLATVMFSFLAGRLYERRSGSVNEFMKGWDRGFDDGVAFANRNKDRIEHYKGKGVWQP